MTDFEDQFYVAHSNTDTILFGKELQNGMRVLIEEDILRGNPNDTKNPYEVSRALETNRWCTVSRVEHTWEMVKFIGVYDDETMRVRRYANTYAWIVKLDSIPTEQ